MSYLAGDIGGTKTHLALYQDQGGKTTCVKNQKFPSKDYPNLRTIVKKFLIGVGLEIERACFGIAGPVEDGKSKATNLPWIIDSRLLETELKIKKVALINDLEANAYGLKVLSEDEFFVLNEGDSNAQGNQAMVSAGTGLGEAGIFFDGKDHFPFACEGGHTDFGPRNEIEDQLLHYLRKKFEHVSYERILSGPGLYNLYQFVVDTKLEDEDPKTVELINSGDSPRLVSELGLSGDSAACAKTLQLFASIYGSEAGNAALKFFALGGIFLGGGIAPKILEVLKSSQFMDNFKAKGRFAQLLSTIPVKVVLNDNTALLGSMYYARNLIETGKK
ncbi:MAG: glucokinase [Simkania sp.]|nr:glucokinase [Simkania sp.]